MSHRVFEFMKQNKHNSKVLALLAEIWICLKFHWHLKPTHDFTNAIKFFAKNATRIQTITDMLADEKSKKVYNGMIKYRQTWNKKDFPLQHYDKIQYFIDEIKLDENEVFIDCGAFDGDTINSFLKHCPKYKQIIAFEPETANFEKLKAKHKNTPNTILINAGTWNCDGIVSFSGSHGSGKVTCSGEYSISVKSIDNLKIDKVTFIKMDIEGAELDALKGAQKTILRDKPKLAICIYHSDEDIINIPEYIHDLVPEYKLYIRQHHKKPPYATSDTVLYAIM